MTNYRMKTNCKSKNLYSVTIMKLSRLRTVRRKADYIHAELQPASPWHK